MEIVDFGHAQGPDEIIKERLKIFPPLSPGASNASAAAVT